MQAKVGRCGRFRRSIRGWPREPTFMFSVAAQWPMMGSRPRRIIVAMLLVGLLAGGVVPLTSANSSGKANSTGGCGCHSGGSGQVTPSVTGLPAQWSAGQTYGLTVAGTGGPTGSEGGFSLTVDKGTFSNGGTAVNVVNGGSATHSGDSRRSWTLDWTAPSMGSGTAQFNYAVNYVNGNSGNSGDGWGTGSTSVPELVVNSAPTVSNPQLSSGVRGGDAIAFTYTYFDANSDAESGTTIRWYLNGSHQATYDDSSTIPGSVTQRAQEWNLTITPSDGMDAGTPVDVGPITVLNGLPTVVSPSLSPGVPTNESDVNLSFTTDDPEGDPVNVSIEWWRDGVHQPAYDDLTTLPASATEDLQEWNASVLPNDGFEDGPSGFTLPVVIGGPNDIPEVISPTIGPTGARTTDDLQANWTGFDLNDDPVVLVSLQWWRNGAHQAAHDGVNPLPASATTKAESWQARIQVTDGKEVSLVNASNTLVIANTPPTATNVSLGDATPGPSEDLVAQWTFEDIDTDGQSGTLIEWIRDGVVVNGFTGQSTIDADDTFLGDAWSVRITPSDGTDSGTPVTSAIVTVTNTLPVASNLSITPDTPDSLAPLTATWVFSDADDHTDGGSTLWWYKDGFRQTRFDNSTTVGAQFLGIGQAWSFRVVPFDGHDEGAEAWSTEVTIRNLDPSAAFAVSPSSPMMWAQTTFNATASTDADGEIVAWFWAVGERVFTGETITVVLGPGPHEVELTVLDADGGSDTTLILVPVIEAPIPADLAVTAGKETIELSWTWAGASDATFRVYRDSAPITELADLEPVNETNTTRWSEPAVVVGEVHYAVVAVIEGVEAPRVVAAQNAASASVAAQPDLASQAPEGDAELGGLYLVAMVAALAAIAGFAVFERLRSGRDEDGGGLA